MKLEQIAKDGYYAKKDGNYYEFTWEANDTLVIHKDRNSIKANKDEYEIVYVAEGKETEAPEEYDINVSDEPFSTTNYRAGILRKDGQDYPFTLITSIDENDSDERILEVSWERETPEGDKNAIEIEIEKQFRGSNLD